MIKIFQNKIKCTINRGIQSILIFCLIIFITHKLQSQTANNFLQLDPGYKKDMLDKISKLLNDNYVFPKTAENIEMILTSKLDNDEYRNITDPIEFGEILTKDMQDVSKDKHLRINYDPGTASEIKNRKKFYDENDEKNILKALKYENFGFNRIERLNGNIGYIDFRNFAPAKYSYETVASVMKFLSNTDAIIIDLRQNGGGDPTGVQLICSYFFKNIRVHLNDIYYRPDNKTEEYWTLDSIDGKRMPDIDLYILTSHFTFSAAEEFAYDLKNLKRALIIGDTTGGGAHPGDVMYIDNNYVIFMPKGRAINPITKTNWERVGVTPDVYIQSDKAFEKAQIIALEKIAKKNNDSSQQKIISSQIEILESVINPINLETSTLQSYEGQYEDRNITFEDGKLYYQRTGRPKFQMIPLSEDTFGFKELDFFKLKFVKDYSGKVVEVNGIYSDGHTDTSKRN